MTNEETRAELIKNFKNHLLNSQTHTLDNEKKYDVVNLIEFPGH